LVSTKLDTFCYPTVQSWLRYCSDVAQRRSSKLCTIFGRLRGCYTVYTCLGLLPPDGILPRAKNSLCLQLSSSPILAALLHGTPAPGVSQTLLRNTRNGITELSQTAPPIFGRAAVTLGIGQHSSIQPLSHFPVFGMSLWPPCVADAYIIFSSCGYGHPIE